MSVSCVPFFDFAGMLRVLNVHVFTGGASGLDLPLVGTDGQTPHRTVSIERVHVAALWLARVGSSQGPANLSVQKLGVSLRQRGSQGRAPQHNGTRRRGGGDCCRLKQRTETRACGLTVGRAELGSGPLRTMQLLAGRSSRPRDSPFENLYSVGVTLLVVVLSVALYRSNSELEVLSNALYRSNNENEILRKSSEEMHRRAQEINLEMYQELQQEMHRRLAIVEETQHDLAGQGLIDGNGAVPGRLLQSGDCLTTEEVSEAAVNAVRTAFIVKEDQVALSAALDDKADQSAVDSLNVAIAEKADIAALNALAAQFGSGPVVEEAEVTPCRCAECADEPVGGDLCASYGPATPCECEDSSGSSDPVRQTYPMTQSDPPCCREEWPAAPTVTQATTTSPQVFDEDDIMVRIDGQVTFVWTGFENLEQVGDFVSYTPVPDGIRSGTGVDGWAGSFTHTFDTAGEYYLRSYVHDSLQVKVTVMECVSCIAVAGYDGANPATLALALSSRAAGDFALAISSAGMARLMTLLTVYDGQTLTLTGEDSEAGQLPLADATITALDGASVVVNNAYVSGGVALAQRATLEDNTGQVAPTASGMAIPKVEPTPAIENAAVASIDESADTVTLAQIDASVAAGQALQLSDAAGQTCAAAPKGQDLTVLSVSGASVSFSTDITSGDASASTNCVLGRAESYDLPACEAGDPPAVIYTRDPGLDMDVLMTCSEMGGEAAWRSVLTMGGVIFDSPDIAGFIAAIGSGLPGMYVLRLIGDAQSFSIPQLDIFPYQDVRILSTATGDSTLEFETSAGHPSPTGVVIAAAAQFTIVGSIVLTDTRLLACLASTGHNQGLASLSDNVQVTLRDGSTPVVSGSLPGTLTATLNGATVGTVSRASADDDATASDLWVEYYHYQGGTLVLMPLASNPGGDNQAGTNWYIDLCDAAGLSAVGCTSGNYATNSMYTQGGRGGGVGVNGWGDMSCNIDGWISSNTGWSNFIHLQSEGSNLHGDSAGTGTSNYGSSSPVHPICAIRP
eukprot:COSAG02_NODE_5716_length_4101_cov_2.727886_1_plen_1022_part_00